MLIREINGFHFSSCLLCGCSCVTAWNVRTDFGFFGHPGFAPFSSNHLCSTLQACYEQRQESIVVQLLGRVTPSLSHLGIPESPDL